MPIDIDMITHRIDLLRLDAGTRQDVLDDLNRLGLQLERMLRDSANLTTYSRARINELLNNASDAIDKYYTSIQGTVDDSLTAVASSQVNAATDAIDTAVAGIEATLPTESVINNLVQRVIIFGSPAKAWWAKQSEDLAARFAMAVRTGMMQGATNEQIVKTIVGTPEQPGIMAVPSRDARTLVHASIQTVANRSALDTFRANSDIVDGFKHISTLDAHTTDICIAYGTDGEDGNGAEYDLEGNPLDGTELPFNGGPPLHWGCRSIIIPITKSFQSMGIDIPEPPSLGRASSSGTTGATMQDWIDSRTPEQLDEQLGAGRAELYRQGKITLQQLLDLRGQPLTFAELQSKYG